MPAQPRCPVADRLDGLVALLRRAGRHLVADPQAERERLLAPLCLVFLAESLHRAEQGRGALELLQRQQAQRVASFSAVCT